MNTTPYWFASIKRPTFRAINRTLSVDVLVVGAGVTGIVTAYLLKQAGLRVALLEVGASPNAIPAIPPRISLTSPNSLDELAKLYSREQAKATIDAGAFAIDEIERIARKEKIECEFSRVPGYLHAPLTGGQEDVRVRLKKDAQIANDFGFEASYLDRVPFMNRPGVRFADQAKFHPLKFLFPLAKKIHGGGSHVFEKSEVKKFDPDKKRAQANGRWINYDRVVLATNNPLLGESSLIKGMIFQMKLMLIFVLCHRRENPAGLHSDCILLGHE